MLLAGPVHAVMEEAAAAQHLFALVGREHVPGQLSDHCIHEEVEKENCVAALVYHYTPNEEG